VGIVSIETCPQQGYLSSLLVINESLRRNGLLGLARLTGLLLHHLAVLVHHGTAHLLIVS
jgi:hypothetical protein